MTLKRRLYAIYVKRAMAWSAKMNYKYLRSTCRALEGLHMLIRPHVLCACRGGGTPTSSSMAVHKPTVPDLPSSLCAGE